MWFMMPTSHCLIFFFVEVLEQMLKVVSIKNNGRFKVALIVSDWLGSAALCNILFC
jgi:hypothetical protein